MVKTEVGKFEIDVKKVGRKWIEIDSRCKAQVEINELTKDFEIGKKYLIYAKRKIDKNRYGTTIKYYPIQESEYKDKLSEAKKEKCKELLNKYSTFERRHRETRQRILEYAKDDKELIDRLKNIESELILKEERSELNSINKSIQRCMGFDSSADYKFNYIKEKIRDIDKLNSLKEEDEEVVMEARGKALLKCFTCINNMDNIIAKFDALEELKSDFNCNNQPLYNDVQNECDDYCEKYISKVEFLYRKGYAIKVKDNEIFNYASEDIKKKISSLKEEVKKVNTEMYRNEIGNIFNIRTEESLKKVLERLGVEYKSENFNQYKAFDGNYYILNYRLTPEMFKVAKNECELSLMNYGEYIRTNEYICADPYRLLYKLIEGGYIETNKDKSITDEDRIELWSDEIIRPFKYKKELINNELYYFVIKELSSIKYSNYNAYYIVGWDNDTKRGFSHRLPWAEDKYENMSVSEIIGEVFKTNEGYKRIQGDVIVKEYDTQNIEYIYEKVMRKIVLNGKEYTFEVGYSENKYKADEYKPADLKNNTKYKTLKEYRIDYRKNLYVEGLKINGLNDAFDSCTVYCNGKEIFKSDVPVKFNFSEIGTKLKYNLYYENIVYSSSCEIITRRETECELIYNGKVEDRIDVNDIENVTVFLGDHKLTCKSNNEKNKIYGDIDSIICFGEFTLNHSEHSFVRYGEKNKAYKIQLAVRHKKKRYFKRD